VTDTPGAETRWLDEDEQNSWRALMIGMTLLLDRLDDDLHRACNLSLVEYEILVRLSERDDRQMRMAQLADALAHSRSRVTHTVARMERAGLVLRSSSPEDGRGVVATLTDRGFELLSRVAPVHVGGVRKNLVDLVEINEAFAAQVVPSYQDLGIDLDRLNVNGVALAVGHPFGMTGARLQNTMLNSLDWHDKSTGLITMCVGGGQGMALILERV